MPKKLKRHVIFVEITTAQKVKKNANFNNQLVTDGNKAIV